MNEDPDDDIPWNPPPRARELLRAAREARPMTDEEEDRAIERAVRGLAASRRKATRQRRKKIALVGVVLVACAAGAVVLSLPRPAPPRASSIARQRSPDQQAPDAGPVPRR